MKRKVEEIDLHLTHPSASTIFSPSFFNCDSLTLLEISTTINHGEFIVPDTVSFPKLKKLRLSNLIFVDETSTRKLFSNCPILEELSLFGCRMSEGLCIVNPALKHLSIDCCSLSESTVKISAPNLLTISYTGKPPADFVLNNFASLIKAVVKIYVDDDGYKYRSETFVNLLEKLSSAKTLTISADTFLGLREADILLTCSLAFNNLIHLDVALMFINWRSGSDTFSYVRNLLRFLQLSPNVESIVFYRRFDIPYEEDDCSWSLDPKFSLQHLKSIKFKYLHGVPVELNLIKFFLKYARFLQTVTVVASPELSNPSGGKQTNVMKQLLMFPRPADSVVRFLTWCEKDY